MSYFITLAVSAVGATAVVAFACAIAQGYVIRGAVEGVARQPEAGGRILITMIIGLALIESLTIYALILGFTLIKNLPETKDVLSLVKGG
jgi:F-type H+-transporting ATPase subunit c